ncbi:apolipoprotein N-acyltransferase [Spirochaetia bacterium 38H-sp]|uniref:Apolipoprotein N-acyltransferase n=1 Tax=Rarispira pelagica TaxID=3141764 RepID=A0ABU9UDQ6_9SPIR
MKKLLSFFEGRSISKRFFLVLCSAVLFALSFPNPLVRGGIGVLGFFALLPIFPVIRHSSWKTIWLYGLYHGFASYALYNFWLATFHPLAIFIVPPIYAFYGIFLFLALKLAIYFFPNRGYILQTFIWVAYEYLKTTGFLGYPYGIIGYSQYAFIPFIQIASLGGVWPVSLMVVFPSAFWGNLLASSNVSLSLKQEKIPALVYVGLFTLILIYGFFSQVDYSASPTWRVALVQHNKDPWKGGLVAYRDGFNRLRRLSEDAIKESPDLDAVIWSETAFVPSLYWHMYVRTNPLSTRLVEELLAYLESRKGYTFVFGNDDGRPVRIDDGKVERIDYNGVYAYINGKLSEPPYRKLHLVPFTEHFPYEKQLPFLYNLLKNADTHFWEKGTDYTIFDDGKARFFTLVCFEDTFGYLAREFIKRGAQVIINVGNDSWAGVVSNEMQHMTVALFRAIENRRFFARATNGGMTVVISPNGRILAQLEPFTEDYLIYDIPVYDSVTTLYTLWGDWFAYLSLYASVLALAAGFVLRLIKKGRAD